jgi:hypothetical protein
MTGLLTNNLNFADDPRAEEEVIRDVLCRYMPVMCRVTANSGSTLRRCQVTSRRDPQETSSNSTGVGCWLRISEPA